MLVYIVENPLKGECLWRDFEGNVAGNVETGAGSIHHGH